MKIFLILVLTLVCISSCEQNGHTDPNPNFTVQRLIILNDKNEMLMCREENVWTTPSFIYNKPQYLKEGLDSLSIAYGIKISQPKLRGYFSFKYDYQPYSTLRSYFVAHYVEGEVKIPEGMDDARWVPLDIAIEKNNVTAIRQITEQIINFPDEVWGGSFLVSHVGGIHPTKMVESFYPL